MAASEQTAPAAPGFRPGGPGPLYWSTYDYENVSNTIIPEAVWKTNIDWVAETFRDYGYTMVCTDGWIDNTQKVTRARLHRQPGGRLGARLGLVGQVPAVQGDAARRLLQPAVGHEVGRHRSRPSPSWAGRDVKVADIVNANDYFDGGGQLQWVDTTRDGAEEYVKGYVSYFRDLGAVFLRIDFLAYYETGFDQNDGTVGVNHGRDGYVRALQWMREAAGDMQLSLVLPNLFDHGSAERQYGDLIRIDNDAGFGTWFTFSGGRETWQPEWSQWNNPFMGFTGFADISGRGQVILDGDPLIMRTFTRDEERQSAINLFTMAGAAIAITDQVDTIADNAHVFQNREVLALRKAGLVGKPVFNNSHALDYDPTSRDPERWIGQLPDGSWAVGLVQPLRRRRDQVDHLRRHPRLQRPGGRARPLGPPGPGFHDRLPDDAGAARLGAPVGRAAGSGAALPGRGRRLGGFGPLREHLRRPRGDGLRHRPRERGQQRGHRHRRPESRDAGASNAAWPTPPGARPR